MLRKVIKEKTEKRHEEDQRQCYSTSWWTRMATKDSNRMKWHIAEKIGVIGLLNTAANLAFCWQ